MTPRPGPRRRHFAPKALGWRGWVLVAASLVLLASAGAKLRGGFYDLAVSSRVRPVVGPPIDLRYRWVEWRYVFGRGVDPFDVYLWEQPEGPVEAARSSPGAGRPDAALGPVLRASYPPWSYPLATPALAWRWPAARRAMALFDAAGLVALAALGGWFARAAAWPVAAACAALSLAAAQHYTLLRLGQPAVVVVALLAGAMICLSNDGEEPGVVKGDGLDGRPDPRLPPRRRESGLRVTGWKSGSSVRGVGLEFVAGVLVGVALLKPTLAVPFVLVLLVRRRWWAAAACTGVVAAAAAVTWARTGVDPLTMTRQMLAVGGQIEASKGLSEGVADGPVLWLRAAGLSSTAASRVAAAAVLAALAAGLGLTRRRPVWQAFALAALAAQLWAHHKPYDEIVLLLLVLPAGAALLARWLRETRPAVAAACLGAAGVLALTLVHFGLLRVAGPRAFGLFQLAAWLGAAAWVLSRPAGGAVVPAGGGS